MKRHFVLIPALLALAIASGCSAPSNLDVALTHSTKEHAYTVVLVPPDAKPAINQIHSWKIKLATANGAPISKARISVDGGMPQHGHGLPTQPQVTKELEDGTYLLEGMKFSMTGWWEIKLAIETASGIDKVTFNTVVTSPDAKN